MKYLTLYQTTNFKTGPNSKDLQTKYSKCKFKTEILFGMGRKSCWKRRKCWLPAFSPFPAVFSKGFLLGSLNVVIVW